MLKQELTLKEKIKYFAEDHGIISHNKNSAYHFYGIHTIKNTFSEEEMNYICNNLNLIDEYRNMKIPCELKKHNTLDAVTLLTDVGTFVLVDIKYQNILQDKEWIESSNIDLKNIYEKKEITIDEFREIIIRLNYHTSVDKTYTITLGPPESDNGKYIRELFDTYRYYKFLKNIDYSILNRRFGASNYSFLPCIPLEVMNNSKRIVEINENNKERLEYLYENFCKFENNPIISFYIAITKGNKEVENNLEKFKKTLLRPCSTYYFNYTYSYLKENFYETLDDNYLLELYKIHYAKFSRMSEDRVLALAKSIENKEPLIRLKDDSEPVHLSYEHDYYLYKGVPFGLERKRCRESFIEINSENIEDYFIHFNDLFTKLYKKYYAGYIKTIKDESEDNIYEFMKAVILNPNNFSSIAKNPNFTIDEIKKIMKIVKCFGPVAQEKFDAFYKQFCIEERKKVITFHNYLIANKNDKDKIIDIITKFGINPDNVYSEILNNKFVESKVKNTILNIVEPYLSNSLKVIDVLYILDEMLDREITLEEILKEKEIDYKTFDMIYKRLSKRNPILHKYISLSLSKSKRKNNQKLIKLGYSVLQYDIKSQKEFNTIFPKIEFNELLHRLKDTELLSQLLHKASTWEDYYQFDEIVNLETNNKAIK